MSRGETRLETTVYWNKLVIFLGVGEEKLTEVDDYLPRRYVLIQSVPDKSYP